MTDTVVKDAALNNGASRATIPKRGRGRPMGFAASTAALTGESKSQINRHLARAEAIGPDLLRLTGTSLDKYVELDALAKMPEPERKELMERAIAGEAVSARAYIKAERAIHVTPYDIARDVAVNAYNTAVKSYKATPSAPLYEAIVLLRKAATILIMAGEEST